jgi:filamentous hemagglutinin
VLAPGGDVTIQAKKVDIVEARETNKQSTEQKFEQSGLTLAVTSGLVSNLQGAQKQQQAASQTKDDRMKALAVANQVASVSAAAQSAQQLDVSLSIGTSRSQSQQTSQSDTARGSTVAAGGTTTIKAIGAWQASNLNLQGSDVSGKTVNLEADNQVSLLAAANTNSQTSSSSNSSASVGISAGTSGLGVIASASLGRGNGNGTDTSYTNTHIAGQDSVSIKSGGDTTLKGATVEGKQVTATVGGSLNIESLQDTSTYKEKNQQLGGSVMVGLTDKGPVKGNINYGQSNINSDYASVAEQSGLKAGDGGFNVNVQGNTDLKGGAITSTQAALDNNKNSFQTGGTLTTSDIQNKASFDAKSVSVTLGMGSTPGQSASAGMSGVGFGTDSGKANSTTTAGISGVAGDTTKRTGDKEQGINQIFNKDQVKAEVNAQTAITSEFGKNASKAVGDYAATKLEEAKKNNDQAGIDAWKEGGTNRVALHTVVGGLTGGAAGAVGAGSASAAAPSIDALQTQLQQGLQSAGLGESASKVIASLTAGTTAAGIGAAASGGSVAGGATAFNADMNNRQLSLPERQNALNLAAKSGGKYTAQQIEDALRTASNTAKGETPASNVIINPNVDKALGNNPTDPVASTNFDKGAVFNAGEGGSIVQVNRDGTPLGSKPVDAELAAYIQANTGGANSPYKWVTPQAGTANPNAGLNTITPASNGCVTAECAAGVAPNRNSIRDSADVRNDVADGAALTSRGAGIVGSAATAAAAVPGPHEPAAAATAATATGVGLVADVVEQMIRPDPQKYFKEQILIGIPANVLAEKFPLYAPVVNEVAEKIKSEVR